MLLCNIVNANKRMKNGVGQGTRIVRYCV